MFHGHDQYFYLQIVVTHMEIMRLQTKQPHRENLFLAFFQDFIKRSRSVTRAQWSPVDPTGWQFQTV